MIENKDTGQNFSTSVIQTEAVFTWLRQNTRRQKKLPEKDGFIKSCFRRLKTYSAKYLLKDFIHKVFFDGKNRYFQRRYFFPVFISNGGAFIAILLVFFGLKNYQFLVFSADAIVAVIAAGLIAGMTTFIFQKHQNSEIEQFSQLNEIGEGYSISLQLKKLFCSSSLKRAAIHLKKEVDSLNDLLAMTSILLSLGVLLGSYGIMLDSFWESHSKSLLSQETISKVVAGFIFLSGGYIRLFGYFRLRKLRQWQVFLDLSQ